MRTLRMVLFIAGAIGYVILTSALPDFVWFARLGAAIYIAALLFAFRNVPWTEPPPSLNLTERQLDE